MIMCSAIFIRPPGERYPVIIGGFRHANCYEKAMQLGIRDAFGFNTTVEGFINDQNHFLDRYAAKEEAEACGQLKKPTNDKRLFSEDIW